ncbi:MAG: GAF domain-containing SpoIIE family protein phosphatase [Candidatus Kapaibacterium sp.]|jgi:sigma-B regulation protein RsbU (phosphoserine phosphatase)
MTDKLSLTSLINLESLLDFSARLNESNDEYFICNSLILTIMGKLRLLRCCVLVPHNDDLRVLVAKGKIEFSEIAVFSIDTPIHITADFAPVLFDNGFRYCFPLLHHDTVMAIVCVGAIPSNTLTDEEIQYGTLVCSIAANALHSARANADIVRQKNEMEMQNQLLTTIFEVNREFSALLSKSQILQMFSYRLMGQMMVSRFAVFTMNNSKVETIINRFSAIFTPDIIQECSAIEDTRYSSFSSMRHQTKALFDAAGVKLVTKMIIHGEVRGLLFVGGKLNNTEFTQMNEQFIESMGNIMLSALENARLFQEELQKKRLESELSLATEIQRGLLPSVLPTLQGFSCAATSIPSKQVGGDYYDFIHLADGRLLIAIADVSGKGMPASLLMANVQAALRVLAPLHMKLDELVSRINAIVYNNTSPDKFVTFFAALFDPQTSSFTYINAGHNPPFIIRADGRIEELQCGGIILGILENAPPYNTGTTTIENGDAVIMYTDGVSEAMNNNNDEFGEDTLREISLAVRHADANTILDTIVVHVHKHADGAPQSDDITLAIIKYHEKK